MRHIILNFKRLLIYPFGRMRKLGMVLGWRTAFFYVFYWRTRMVRKKYWLRPKQIEFPVCVRAGTSDQKVFNQIFVEREYQCLDDVENVQLVIDCGANTGYSSVYFLNQFPLCRVVAVEPAKNNFELLKCNLAVYGNRATLVRAGVWSDCAPLVISEKIYRDGHDWSQQVRLCRDGEEADIDGVDVGSLLAESGCDRISILKMDIEGAEAEVFFETYKSWIDKVDVIAIELHDDTFFGKASEIFFSAISDCGFCISHSAELTICRRDK